MGYLRNLDEEMQEMRRWLQEACIRYCRPWEALHGFSTTGKSGIAIWKGGVMEICGPTRELLRKR